MRLCAFSVIESNEPMSTGRYLLGAAELAVIATALGIGAYHLRALLAPAWTGALARLAEVVIGISMLILVSEVLGVLGLFKEVPLLLGYRRRRPGRDRTACAAAGSARRPRRPRRDRARSWSRSGSRPRRWSSSTGPIPTGQAVDQGMYYQDTTWYHMSFSARFAQTGHVGPLHFTDPLKLAAWFYPQNSELLHGVGIVFLKTDFLSPLINLMWVALCLLAAWCVGRPYGIGGVTVLGAAVVLRLGDAGRLAGRAGAQRRGGALLPHGRDCLPGRWRRTARTRPVKRGRRRSNPGWSRTSRSRGIHARWRRSVRGRSSWRASRPASGSAPRSPSWPRSPPHDRRRDPRRPTPLAAGARRLARRNGDHLRLLVRAELRLRARTRSRRSTRLGPIHLPGPDQLALYPRPPHSLSEYYNDPSGLAAQALPGAPRSARPALAGDPRGRGRRPGLGVLPGRQRPDADPRGDRDGRWASPTSSLR